MNYSPDNIDGPNYYFYNRSVHSVGNPFHNLLADSFPMENLPNYKQWSCDQWVDFHRRLKSKYGKANANLVWQEFWNNKPHGWLGDQCVRESSFTSYFKNQGITFNESFFSIVGKFGSNVKTGLIVAGVVVGGALAAYLVFLAWNAITVQKIAHRGLKKAADNPDLIAEGAARGLKGG